MSATLLEIHNAIEQITRFDQLEPEDIDSLINNAVTRISAGVSLPDGRITPPLPDLFSSATVATATDAAYKTLGATYQRNLFMVSDSNDDLVRPPRGGDYYSFNMFLRGARYKDLSESGSIYMCCVKGSNLYYQGIPSTSENLLTYFYRKPVDMTDNSDTPDGIPDPFQLDLLKHFVCMDIYGKYVGQDLKAQTGDKFLRRYDYHRQKVNILLFDMVAFIGEEGEPHYFSSDYEEEW